MVEFYTVQGFFCLKEKKNILGMYLRSALFFCFSFFSFYDEKGSVVDMKNTDVSHCCHTKSQHFHSNGLCKLQSLMTIYTIKTIKCGEITTTYFAKMSFNSYTHVSYCFFLVVSERCLWLENP